MANEPLMSQDEIERLFSQTKSPAAPAASKVAATATASPPAAAPFEAADSAPLSQDNIDGLLKQAAVQASPRPAAGPMPAPSRPPAGSPSDDLGISAPDIDYLLNQAEQALESATSARPGSFPAGANTYRLEEFSGSTSSAQSATIDLIRDVELDLRIELGRTNMYLEDVLKLRAGSVVPLDKLAGDPVDIYVNGRLVARGEVLVLNDNFCVRLAELIAGTNTFT